MQLYELPFQIRRIKMRAGIVSKGNPQRSSASRGQDSTGAKHRWIVRCGVLRRNVTRLTEGFKKLGKELITKNKIKYASI